MLQGAIHNPVIHSRPKRRRLPSLKVLIPGLCALMILAALGAWLSTRTHVMSLGSEQQLLDSGVYAQWAKGKVIVLIRHAERCDRSSNPCLDDPTGITKSGSQAALEVGNGLQRLGLENTDILASPEVRTQQTAHFIFGKAIVIRDWIGQCDSSFPKAALQNKRPDYNLVLVTHSGCIDHVERQLKVPGGEREAEYASALFISMDKQGKARILGQMNANEWRKIVASAGN